MDRPESLNDMTQPDETEHKAKVVTNSIAAKSKEQLEQEASSARRSGEDPISRIVIQDSDVEGFYTKPRPQNPIHVSGQVDPIFGRSGFAIGDRVYRSKNKAEGIVKDIAASGKVLIKLEGHKPGWVEPDTIVKLEESNAKRRR